jgi:hypothetical protein
MAFNNPRTAAAAALAPLVPPYTPPGSIAYSYDSPFPLTAAELAKPATGFSPSFQARLRKAVPPAITPDNFIKSFENYITTTKGNASMNESANSWVYQIPVEVKNSPLFLQCLFALKKDIESTGYRSEQNYTKAYNMTPGTYAIITQLPHTCQSYCKREGCDIRYKSTLESDPTACSIAICI